VNLELERARANELLRRQLIRPGSLGDAGGEDERLGAGEEAREDTGGLLEGHGHGRRIGRIDGVEPLEDELAASVDLAPALERRDDIGGGHLRAIVERDAGAQLERVGEAIRRGLVILDQQRLGIELAVEREKPLEHLRGDIVGDGRGREHGVRHRRWLAHDRGLQRAALGELLRRVLGE
jgi:hypothetical protein